VDGGKDRIVEIGKPRNAGQINEGTFNNKAQKMSHKEANGWVKRV
jgi:hypothetical protein